MMATESRQLSERARRVLELLRRANATAPERALTDRVVASRVHCPVREVIDLAAEIETLDVAVLASCGSASGSSAGKGRYIEADPLKVRAYSNALHSRAKSIHMRAKRYRRLAERMEENAAVDSRGQRRLFR